jgi:CheY-like chemotaxis protein
VIYGGSVQILVVEDSAAQRLVLCRILQALGHHTVQAADAEAARDAAQNHSFDVVISDISLPGMSGASLMRTLRAEGHTARMIAVTAGTPDTAGADAILRKPVSRRAIEQVLAGRSPSVRRQTCTLLDTSQIEQLRANVGGEQTRKLLRRFMDEADVVCAQKAPDTMALHHLAGSAGLFGARALHAALIAGAWQTIWPATRTALLTMLDQPA